MRAKQLKNCYDEHMNLKIFRIAWLAILALILIWIGWQTIVPMGSISYTHDFSSETYRFSKLLPAERVVDSKTVIDEPVYFTVYTPRAFRKAILKLRFEEPSPAMQIGIAHNKAQWDFDFKPVSAGSLETELVFDARLAERIRGRYSFMLSDPALRTKGDSIKVKNVSIEFTD